ncbi:hypothetical protein ACLB2K_040354 [Fragaria x ananassa]
MADSGLLGFAVRKRIEYSLTFFGLWQEKRNMMWLDLTQKAKDGGLDMIQTYVFWDGQDPSPGKDRYDVIKFIKLAQQHGIHLHIGPYNRLRLQNVHRSVLDIHIKDLAGLDNQFQTFTEVFESVVSGFEAAKEDVYSVALCAEIELRRGGKLDLGFQNLGIDVKTWALRFVLIRCLG